MTNKKTLLLNADYLAIGVIPVSRAFVLIFQDKAEVVAEEENEVIRSAKTTFPYPSVVRLKRYVQVPHRKIPLTRSNIFKRDDFKCTYCGAKANLTLDHVIPKSQGGPTSWKNLITACKPCNARKDDRTPEQAGMEFRYSKPYRPSFVMYASTMHQIRESWKPYLYMT